MRVSGWKITGKTSGRKGKRVGFRLNHPNRIPADGVGGRIFRCLLGDEEDEKPDQLLTVRGFSVTNLAGF